MIVGKRLAPSSHNNNHSSSRSNSPSRRSSYINNNNNNNNSLNGAKVGWVEYGAIDDAIIEKLKDDEDVRVRLQGAEELHAAVRGMKAREKTSTSL